MDIAHIENYKKIAKEARIKILSLIFKAQTSHIGSNFGCIDILAVLFQIIDLNIDKFILSKGWVAASLYYFLWLKGRISLEDLDSYCKRGSKWIGLAEPVHADIPFAGGSMQLGTGAVAGFALSKKLKGEKGKIYCLESDGALDGGIVWEMALFAAYHKLNNIILIIEMNGWQAMNKKSEVLNVEPLDEKFRSFGWEIRKVKDGHNYISLERALTYPPLYADKPIVILVNTIKGKGISFMEDNNLYHYLKVDEKDYQLALKELNV